MASVKARAEKMLSILEKAYGVPRPPKGLEDPLDYTVYGVVGTFVPGEVCERGYRALTREFVDWNELRVATWREIGDVLEKARVADPGRKAVTLKRALMQMYSRLNKVTLDLVEDMGADEARRYVEGFSDWPPQSVGAFFYGYTGSKGVPPTEGACRVAERAGFMKKKLTQNKQSSALKSLVSSAKHYRFHQILAALSDIICIHKDPRCAECPVVEQCDTGQAWLAEQDADTGTPGKKKAKKKSSAKSAKKPASKKKKPAAKKKKSAKRK
jgi:endonuclease-3